ncbi:cyclase family protein [Actinoplanes sp. NPDC026619]|uniref:cyclase family protein n=1 Tax=Actinoplanes sp. NPDC026619 TaxID=3155798 RepID=UPI0033EBDD37
MSLPRYDELPPAPAGGRSAWGVFGAGDQLGTLNLQTADRIRAAAALVTRGAMFPLNAPIDAFAHEQWGRRIPRHETVHEPGGIFFDDVLQDFGPQGSSQWDSLGHVGYRPGEFWNGATEADVAAGRRNTIDVVARRGIAGRGVLLDMPATFRELGRDYDPAASVAFGVEELETAYAMARVTPEAGDILMLYTGYAENFAALTTRERTERPFVCPGLAHDEQVVRWLWDRQLSAIASDNLAIEAWPIDLGPDAFPFGALHNMLIGRLGFTLGELWDLAALARDCAADGRHTVFLVSAPSNIPGGYGSPANVVALK